MRFTRSAPLAVLFLLLAPTVVAQTTQYTAPGGNVGESLPDREQIESEMEEARWRLGPFRLAPWLALRGLTYEDDVFVENEEGDEEATSDVHGSVGAGLSIYLPTGENVFWVVQALPEYLFWIDLDERNQLIGRYGAGVYADLNRLRLGLDGQLAEQQRTVTSESAQQVLSELTSVHAVAELEVSSAFSFAVDAARREHAYELADGSTVSAGFDYSNLDREESVLAGELRYHPSEKIELAVGAESTETDFDSGSRDLSSTGTSPYLRLRLDGNRLLFDARVVRRELEPEPGSALLPVDRTQGSARVELDLSHRFVLSLYGSLSTAYALAADYTQFDEERLGVGVGLPLSERLSLTAFYEAGSDDYEPIPDSLPRSDDVTSWGAGATFQIGEWLHYRAGVTQVDYRSNLPDFDRDYLRIDSSVVLSTGDWVWR
jgi:hypothetical protein